MRPVPTVIAASGSAAFAETLRRPGSGFLVLRQTADPVELVSAATVLRPALVLVEVDCPEVAGVVGELSQSAALVLAVGSPAAATHRDAAQSWGLPLTDGSPPELARLLSSRPAAVGAAAPSARGRVVAVCGPAGSPGVSCVAGNLAAELPGESILVDADPGAAAQAFIFGARAEPAGLLAALARSRAGVIDRDSWLSCLTPVAGEVLLATGTADGAALAEFADGLAAVADASRRCAAATVLDCGSGDLPEWGARAVADAEAVVVVASPTALGIHRLSRWWSVHRPVLSGSVVLAWNRVGGSGSSALGPDPVARLREASALAGAGVGFAVLSEDDDAAAAMNRRPGPLVDVAPDCELRSGLRDLAARLL